MKPELELVAENVRRFADEVVRPALGELVHYPEGDLPARLLPGLGELGLLELGADDASIVAALEALAERGAFAAGIVLANAVARGLVAATRPELLAKNGNPHPLLGCALYLEPAEPSRLVLERRGDELGLSGRAELIVNAPIADGFVLAARDRDSVALVWVEAGATGVSIGEPLLTLGLRGAPTADVELCDVRIDARKLLAAPGAEVLEAVARASRAAALAVSAGILHESLAAAGDYGKERYQGGKNIIEHQEWRRLLAGMVEDDALCRAAVDALVEGNLPETRALALFTRAKQRASHATVDGVQLFGGYGYMEDYSQERCMRDAKQAEQIFGRVEHARQELAARFAEEGPR